MYKVHAIVFQKVDENETFYQQENKKALVESIKSSDVQNWHSAGDWIPGQNREISKLN